MIILLLCTISNTLSLAAILQQYHDVCDKDGKEATGIYELKVTMFFILVVCSSKL